MWRQLSAPKKAGMKQVFTKIRWDVADAKSRPALTELYKRAGYLITVTYAPSWEQKFGKDAPALRHVGEDEFRKTAHKINRRAAKGGGLAASRVPHIQGSSASISPVR